MNDFRDMNRYVEVIIWGLFFLELKYEMIIFSIFVEMLQVLEMEFIWELGSLKCCFIDVVLMLFILLIIKFKSEGVILFKKNIVIV